MLNMDCPSPTKTTTLSTVNWNFVESSEPHFDVVKTIPPWATKQLEDAVRDFIATSHLPKGVDANGFYFNTIEAIASRTYLGGAGDFWLATFKDCVVGYGLAYISRDVDQKLCYNISQMWAAKEFRGKPIVKEWWKQIRQRAKDCFCKHLVITSSRSSKAYIRFLGHGMHYYCSMLKEEI